MNVIPTQTVTAQPAHEPPRPARHQPQETSLPVLEPTRTEAIAREVRSESRRDSREESSADTHAKASTQDAGHTKPAKDSMVGAILDVFA